MLRDHALLVSVRFRHWTGTKSDMGATEEVIARHHAQPKSARLSKTLIFNEQMKALNNTVARIRREVDKHTLPWGRGTGIYPAAKHADMAEMMEGMSLEYEAAKREFLDHYYEGIKEARSKLGSMFDIEDYPLDIKDRFGFDYTFQPIPDTDDFRVTLSDKFKGEISHLLHDYHNQLLKEALTEAWFRLYAAIGHFANVLQKQEGSTNAIRQGLVGNLHRTAVELKKLNIVNDPELDKACDAVLNELAFLDETTLREDDEARSYALKSAVEMIEDINPEERALAQLAA